MPSTNPRQSVTMEASLVPRLLKTPNKKTVGNRWGHCRGNFIDRFKNAGKISTLYRPKHGCNHYNNSRNTTQKHLRFTGSFRSEAFKHP